MPVDQVSRSQYFHFGDSRKRRGEMGCKSEGCCSVWRIVQSALGIFLGLLSGGVFYWQYGNYQAAGWAFASGKYLILFSLFTYRYVDYEAGWVFDSYQLRQQNRFDIFFEAVSVPSTQCFASELECQKCDHSDIRWHYSSFNLLSL